MAARTNVFCLVLILIKLSISLNLDTGNLKVTAKLTALHPKGLRARIFVDVRATFLIFDGMVYDKIENAISSEKYVFQIWGSGIQQAEGGWIFEDPNTNLKVGQFIKYCVFVTDGNHVGSNKAGQASLHLNGVVSSYHIFEVTVLEDPLAPEAPCLATLTKVRGRPVCAGQVIFEDKFDVLREDLWQIEQYIPVDHPEHPFVSYQRLTSDANVFVENGTLHIVPKLQEDLLRPKNESIISGTLDLTDGCTRRECYKAANGADILPPVVSGRLTSNLAFTYGSVHVRAKLPQGDWLYPEILLEPLFQMYGNQKDLTSILKIAMSGGNKQILDNFYGNAFLVGGPAINKECHNLRSYYLWEGKHGYWGDQFHNYTLRWTPDKITVSVDGNLYMSLDLNSEPFLCFGTSDAADLFSRYVHITLGVAAGGVVAFPNGVRTEMYHLKPWHNEDPKASLNFWQDHESWYPTWTQPSLLVDYIKVVAL